MKTETHEPTAGEAALVASYAKKIRAGEKPTKDEAVAHRKCLERTEEAARWEHYATIPRKHWRQLSGRDHKALDRHFGRFGVPIQKQTIDLSEVARWLHDFLEMAADKADEPDAALWENADGSPALEAYRMEKAKLARLDRLEREGKTLVSLEHVHFFFIALSEVLRAAGETLKRQFGSGAQRILNQALQNCERLYENYCASPPGIRGWNCPDEGGETDSIIESNRLETIEQEAATSARHDLAADSLSEPAGADTSGTAAGKHRGTLSRR